MMLTEASGGSAVKQTDDLSLPTGEGEQMTEEDPNRARVLGACRNGRDEINRLNLFLKEKNDQAIRILTNSGKLKLTRDCREGTEESDGNIQR